MALSKILNASVTNSTLTTTKLATPNLGRRNVLINGGMNVSQRNGTTLTATANNSLFLDRWKCYLNGPSSISTQQMLPLDSNVTALNTASGENYNNIMYIDCTTASAIQSSDLLGVIQLIEGSNSVPLAGQSCTLSFWVKSSVTGQYYVTFKIASARSYIAPYTISSANTWEKKTITITMDTLASLNTNGDTGNGAGFQVYFGLRLGSSAQATSTVNQWVDGNFYGTLSQVTWGTNVSDTFYIGAVQLELGTAASPFEHRSFGEELALCQRYYYHTYSYGSPAGTTFNQDYESPIIIIGTGNHGMGVCNAVYPVEMRVAPTISFYGSDGTANRIRHWGGSLAAYGTVNRSTRQILGMSFNAGTDPEDFYSAALVCDAEL